MVNPVGDILPLAIGVMISPLSIIAVISMLLSKRARSNSLTFLFGWILGLIILGGAVLVIAGTQNFSPGSEPSIGASIIRLLGGVLLLFLAIMEWRISIQIGKQPKLLTRINAMDTFTSAKAFGLGLLLSAAYPKNLTLTIIAALAIVQAQVSGLLNITVFSIFIIISSALVIIPVLASFILGDKAAQTLDSWKAWNVEHYTAVLIVIFLGLAAMNLGKGLNGVFG
ncbi:MAG TPA: GAP family protein [Candidatus Acidoferrales bacterium]|nr:GAP family protein [Candidatus Acidoferrales bacterium]